MTDITKRSVATWVGAVAFACAVMQPAKAADIGPQYYGGPVDEEPVYQAPPPSYRHEYAEPRVYYEPAPPAPVVVVPEPYYVPPRPVYVGPGYRPYGYGPYVRGGYGGYGHYAARGYGYHRGWHGGGGHRHW